uniref:Uncharacterized protein n=1 Tax=Hyaloperonospora arabidopsidis (strain Emoy2) TaxID=559515 RepID=M4BY84_HYAAE
MILSRLWHYTQHLSVPKTTVRRWQSMLNRFVLSRKHDRESSHVQLLPGAFLYQRCSDGGLGVPDLAAHLKRQRLQLLLQLVRGLESPSVRDWTTASSELLLRFIPPTGRRHALDFLTIAPLRHGDMIKWRLANEWWKATWKLWYFLRWEITWHDLPPDDRAWYGLRQPIWFHADRTLHYEQSPRRETISPHRRCIGMAVEPQRSFSLHVSRVFGIRSLSDFVRAGETWPSQNLFVQRFIDFTLASVPPWTQVRWLRVLHTEATQIA